MPYIEFTPPTAAGLPHGPAPSSALPSIYRDDPVTTPTVFIVDDDPVIRSSIAVLLGTAKLASACYASGEDFLSACTDDMDGCLLLDVHMQGMSGTELQERLLQHKIYLPIIFLTGHADLPTGVLAMKQGAVDFLTKPVKGAQLLECVQVAMERGQAQRRAKAARQLFGTNMGRLTQREREILVLALSGIGNKAISAQLGISARTIEGHRSRILLKTGANSLLELAQQAANAGVNLADISLDCLAAA
jgi:FixJ family two-component response regulator